MMSDLSFLRVVWDDEEPAAKERVPSELSPEMTLSEFFWRYAWPDCLQPKGDTPATRKDYVASLNHWTRLTGDPRIAQITDRVCSKFLNRLAGEPGLPNGSSTGTLRANTIRKHWDNIQRLIEWTGPRTRWNRKGTGLVAESPWVDKPPKEFPPPRPAFTLDEIWDWLGALPEHARAMPRMDGLEPAAWWRALILFLYNTGQRPGTALKIRWEMIDGQALRVPTAIIKGHHGRFLWLNDWALEALEPLRRSAGPVFGWHDWPKAESTLRKHLKRIQLAAGIRTISLYGLRRAFSTQCAKISVLATQLMMGHEGAGTKMMIDHYIDHEAILADALSKMPQPGAVRQKRLFD